MAQTVVISGSHKTAKLRNPVGVVALNVVTIGIHTFFWWYYVNRELADFGRARNARELGDSPGLSALALMLGVFTLFVATVLTVVGTTKRVQRAQELCGVEPLSGWLAAILWLFTFGIGGPIYLQSQLNKVWEAPAQAKALAPGGQGEVATPSQGAVAGAPAQESSAGWFPDPWKQAPERYWDGRQWTAHVRGEAATNEPTAAWATIGAEQSMLQAGAASDPGTVTAQATPAGWYLDPWSQAIQRWWDGTQWTGHIR